ncbi:MAG: DegT/DnrJ/EryC1/StrS family aminotransferase [Balneolaceae bacterium]|nr:DegT/DnrJ/EryC1/StrS family aminotransferase [Balneolaceae bacterium]
MGDLGCFSFFPTKNLGGIGDGGLITTDDDELAEKARMLRAHGAHDKYRNQMLGYNSRLDTIQAAVLDVKLKHIDDFNAGRRRVAERYSERLSEIDEIVTPPVTGGHIFHQYTIRVRNGRRDALKGYLKEKGISSKIYFPLPQNELPVYEEKGYRPAPGPQNVRGGVEPADVAPTGRGGY